MNKIYTVEEIAEKSRELFEQHNIQKAILFGSYAYGQPTLKSDVDIMIDTNNEIGGLVFYGLIERLKMKLKKKVHLYEKIEIKTDSGLYFDVFHKGIVIYEKK